MNCRKQQGRNASRRQRASAASMTIEDRLEGGRNGQALEMAVGLAKTAPRPARKGGGATPQWSRERPGFATAPHFFMTENIFMTNAIDLTARQLLANKPKRQRVTQALLRIEDASFEDVLARIRAGESQTEIARSLKVHIATLNRYLSDPSRVAETTAAKADSAEAWLDKGLREIQNAKGFDHAEVQRARAFAQECARRAAIRNPRYSDKAAIQLTDGDGQPLPPQQAIVVYMPSTCRRTIETRERNGLCGQLTRSKERTRR